MRSINGMAERLRDLLASPEPIELPGCYDVLSAMILEKAGFKAVFMSGYGIAASLLGYPDIGLTTVLETSLLTKNVSGALHVPLVVDADNGYGSEDNVVRTVGELELAGAAALILEDQVFPKRCGHSGGKQIIPLDQYMRKLDCALRARQTPLCVVARTDAMSIDEGIARAKQFHSAGADVVLIDGLASTEALKRVGEEVPGHKVINLIYGGKTPLFASRELHDLGFKIVLYSTPALYTAASTMMRAMTLLNESGDLKAISDVSLDFKEFQQFVESAYFRRRGSEGLARVASQVASQATAPAQRADAKFPVEEGTRSRQQRARALSVDTGQA
ncbi:MAG TPA: isocitrate lyase/PEP mutase family protein [Polyangiaceae bacterium]|nr:isocitrate lyase/PEP mutase family protein [Polyangiaceae bacterium]